LQFKRKTAERYFTANRRKKFSWTIHPNIIVIIEFATLARKFIISSWRPVWYKGYLPWIFDIISFTKVTYPLSF